MDNQIELDEKVGEGRPTAAVQRRRSSCVSQNGISLPDVPPVTIEVANVSVSSTKQSTPGHKLGNLFRARKISDGIGVAEAGIGPSSSQVIINDVSAQFPSGSLTAILGSSGSGKTSLSV
jgi:ABC-type multidrug transport system fused ATPase/permease subunit